MRNEIDDGEPVTDNRFQFFLEPGLDDFRKFLAINRASHAIAHVTDFVVRPFNLRG